jgi:predicted nucleic-acid-binding protein
MGGDENHEQDFKKLYRLWKSNENLSENNKIKIQVTRSYWMKSKIKHLLTMFLTICFMFKVNAVDMAFSFSITNNPVRDDLAAGSIFDDLQGIEHKDMANIMVALQANLLSGGREIIDPDELKEDLLLKEKSTFNPANMNFIFSGDGMKPFSENYVSVKCKVKNNGRKLRTYYVVFSTLKEGEAFPMEVFTENEWQRWEGTREKTTVSGILPERSAQKPKDAKAIQRYIQHETGIDKVIRYAHEKGLAEKPAYEVFDYKETIQKLLNTLGISVTAGDGLKTMEDRDFYIIPKTVEIKKMLEENPVELIDENGAGHSVNITAHSSNNAVHIFVDEDYFNSLVKKGDMIQGALSTEGLEKILVYEMGVMLGFPLLMVNTGESGSPERMSNVVYERWLRSVKKEEPGKGISKKAEALINIESMNAMIRDLDTNIMTRDYAADVAIEGNRISQIMKERRDLLKYLRNVAYKNRYASITEEAISYFAILSCSENEREKKEALKWLRNTAYNLDSTGIADAKIISRAAILLYSEDKEEQKDALKILKYKAYKDRYAHVSEVAVAFFAILSYSKEYKEREQSLNWLSYAAYDMKGKGISNAEKWGYVAVLLHSPDQAERDRALDHLRFVAYRQKRIKNDTQRIADAGILLYLDRLLKSKVKIKNNIVEKMSAYARETGESISRPVLKRNYTLITYGNLYKNGREYKEDILEYGSVFDLEKIKPGRPGTIISRILKKIKARGLDPEDVIVQLPKFFSEEKAELKRLVDNAPGIRFIIMNGKGLKNEKKSAAYRKNIYAMMLLARKLDENTPEDSKLALLLKFFMEAYMGKKGNTPDIVDAYMGALVRNDIALIVKTVLSYKPIEKYDIPDYNKIAATLISA